MKVGLKPSIRVEDLGAEVVVLDAERSVMHRLPEGRSAEIVRLLSCSTAKIVTVESDVQAISELIDLGILVEPEGWSRRRVLLAGGAAWTAATVSSFVLADPVAASTMCGSGVIPTTRPATYTTVGSSGMFTTGPAGVGMTTFSLTVHAWGGGGGGAGGSIDSTGGGGGGGEYRGGSVSVNECTTYTVTVGSGGGGGGGTAGSGGDSSFGSLLVAKGGIGGTEPGSGMGVGGAGGMGGSGGTVNYDGGSGGAGSGTNGANSGTGGGGGGSGGAGGAGGNGGNGSTGNNEGAGGAAGAGSPGGAAGASGGDNSSPSGGTSGVPGGGGGGAEEALFGATGGTGARGEVRIP